MHCQGLIQLRCNVAAMQNNSRYDEARPSLPNCALVPTEMSWRSWDRCSGADVVKVHVKGGKIQQE